MEQVKGAFTVRFLRIGDDVYITRSVYRMEDGVRKGTALFQAIDTVSGALSVDWTVPKEQPICEFEARSAVGYSVNLIEATFNYNGAILVFATAGESGWATSTDGRFEMKQEEGKIFFKIIKNIASPTQVANKQIGYSLKYISNGMINEYAGSMDVVIQQAGSDSHILYINTPRVVLDEANPSTRLTLQANYGVKPVTIGTDPTEYTVEWWKDGVKLTNNPNSPDELEVTRADVDGASMYVAKLFLNGTPVAQDGQHISDVADEYQVGVTRTVDFVKENTNAQMDFYLLRNKVFIPTNDSQWTWEIYNALGDQTKEGTSKRIIITAEDCKNVPLEGGQVYYSDANYVGTVTLQ